MKKRNVYRSFSIILAVVLLFGVFAPFSAANEQINVAIVETPVYPALDATVTCNGTITDRGSNLPWRMYSDGTLVVESGFIHWIGFSESPGIGIFLSPWDTLRGSIQRIVFNGPIIGGHGLVWLFGDLPSVTYMRGLDYFDTSNVQIMDGMFSSASGLTSLDLSGWDTGNVRFMSGMFSRTTSLRELTLGENFHFVGNAGLPPVPQNDDFTGYWQNVGDGTASNPQGKFVFTSAELMAQYDGATMADTWVWQPEERVAIPVTNIADGPASATMDVPLTLTGTVVPADATNQTIEWSIVDTGDTGATLDNGVLSAAAAGTVVVRATIAGGGAAEVDFTQDFTVTVEAAPVGEVEIEVSVDEDGNVTVAVDGEDDYDYAVEDGKLLITLSPGADDIDVTLPPGWAYVVEGEGDDVLVIITPPRGFELIEENGEIVVREIQTPVEEIEINVNLAPDGKITIAVEGEDNYDYDVADGNLVIALPPGTDKDNIEVSLPLGWTYVVEVEGNGVLVIITPPRGYELDEDGDGNIIAREIPFPFADVSEDHWAREYVEFVYRHDPMLMGATNTAGDAFSPDDGFTRAQVVTVLWRIASSLEYTFDAERFPDVQDSGAWYATAAMWASENGIVNGIPRDDVIYFDGGVNVSREQFALMMYRFAEFSNWITTHDLAVLFDFPDAGTVNDWAAEGLAWAVEFDLIRGVPVDEENHLHPQDTLVRSAAAAIFARLMGNGEIRG